MSTSSGTRIPFDLRPSKQVERRMIVDLLISLAISGFPISSYRYIGMGGMHFVDFVLFHKLLGITDMLSAEHDIDVQSRIKFNCPFSFIKLQFGDVGEVLGKIESDRRHLIWLDYDAPLSSEIVQDVVTALSSLAAGSVFFSYLGSRVADSRREEFSGGTFEFYSNEVGKYFDVGWDKGRFTQSNVASSIRRIVTKVALSGLSGRPEFELSPVFNFEYRDGRRMLTLGGMVCDGAAKGRLVRCSFRHQKFVRRSLEDGPFEIAAPVLTRKERIYADGEMPSRRMKIFQGDFRMGCGCSGTLQSSVSLSSVLRGVADDVGARRDRGLESPKRGTLGRVQGRRQVVPSGPSISSTPAAVNSARIASALAKSRVLRAFPRSTMRASITAASSRGVADRNHALGVSCRRPRRLALARRPPLRRAGRAAPSALNAVSASACIAASALGVFRSSHAASTTAAGGSLSAASTPSNACSAP